MRIDKTANLPLAQVRISTRPADKPAIRDLATRTIVAALACAVLFLGVRILGLI